MGLNGQTPRIPVMGGKNANTLRPVPRALPVTIPAANSATPNRTRRTRPVGVLMNDRKFLITYLA